MLNLRVLFRGETRKPNPKFICSCSTGSGQTKLLKLRGKKVMVTFQIIFCEFVRSIMLIVVVYEHMRTDACVKNITWKWCADIF